MKGGWRCGTAALALLLAGVGAAPAFAGNRNVLVLDTGVPGRPLATAMIGAFRDTLLGSPSEPVSLYEEALDLERFPGEADVARVRTFLAGKYRERPPEVIVAIADPAIRLVLEWRDPPWPAPALVFAAANPATIQAARASGIATGVAASLDVPGTLRAALTLIPEADEVVVVAGHDIYLPLLDQALESLGNRVRVTRLVDLSLAETRLRLAALSPRSFVYYSQITFDGAGRGLFGRRSLEELAPVSNRPIFGHYGTYLGHGIVGGSLLEPDVIGREAADLAAQVLAGTPPAAIPVVRSRSNRLLFDWRELRRFGLDEARLPPGSEVRFREATLFEEHRATVVTAAILLVVQAGLIAALAAAVRRRRAAQRQLRALSGRILTAQEDERSRIARELHDSVSQELALYAIDLDHLAAGVSTPTEVPIQAKALGRRARDLSRDLHRIAHELHPAILDQLGLVPALRQFSASFGARHGIEVDVAASDWPAAVPDVVNLVLYRIAQEALQNVAKHSGASEARISLRGSAKGVTLLVSDRGRGFDPKANAPGASLGLAGMRERLRLVGGELCVDSSPEGGTVIAAGVPRRVMAIGATAADPEETAAEESGDGKAPSPAR